jgi:hypothetical protein
MTINTALPTVIPRATNNLSRRRHPDRIRLGGDGASALRLGIARLALFVATLTCTTAIAASDISSERLYPQTEVREPCAHYDPLRQPFFGTTHLHTGLSFDASIRFVEMSAGNNPHGAYAFAQGKTHITLPGPLGEQGETELRRPRIDRPLDWGGVTDHAELFGEMGLCKNQLGPETPGRLSLECRMINGFYYQLPQNLSNDMARTFASNAFTQLTMAGLGPISDHTTTALCEENPRACRYAELKVWDEVRQAAETAYDRSESCRFTSFVAYENTSTPLGTNWHRNVFFRNDQVVHRPVTSIDMGVRTNPSPTRGGPDGVGIAPSYVGGEVPTDDPWVYPVPAGEVVTHPLPQRFWNRLEWGCQQGQDLAAGGVDRGCDFIAIPHNTNLGGGIGYVPPLYFDPFNAEDARRKARFEPLVEIYQDKGSSECRWDQRFQDDPSLAPGVDTLDEYCNFELLDTNSLNSASGVGGSGTSFKMAPDAFNRRAFVRNIWKDGMLLAEQPGFEGVNPFKMGVVAASDSHTGVMGWHPETADWPGHLGIDDVWPMARPSSIQNSTGGHSVAWAEENSRDAIFAAMRRKETYGTSGTRIVARFFGGWDYDADLCERGYDNLVRQGYERGVPMGGDLTPAPRPQAVPSFAVAAIWDDFIGTPLEQIQLIKGWIDEAGQAREVVYRLAGDEGDAITPETGVDPATCRPNTAGHERLCAVFSDPDFDPAERAFYYLRVLEKPVCRYSTHWCRERIGVDPLDAENCASDLQALKDSDNAEDQQRAAHGAQCCNNQFSDVLVQPVIQERAWTSPIWYEPAGA